MCNRSIRSAVPRLSVAMSLSALLFSGCGEPLQTSAQSIVQGRAATDANFYSTVAIELPMGVCTGTLLRLTWC